MTVCKVCKNVITNICDVTLASGGIMVQKIIKVVTLPDAVCL